MTARRALARAATTAVLAAGLSGCRSSPTTEPRSTGLDDDAITVASFNFGESEILAEIYSQALEAGGYAVERAFQLGPRELVAPALEQGLVELVPDYGGTALGFLSLGRDAATADVTATHDALARVAKRRHVAALAASPAQDANTFAVTKATAAALHLQTLSDLAPDASTMTFGGPPECPTRALCLRGLEAVYGLSFERFLPLDAGGPTTHRALADGYVDVALLFTTDPSLRSGELVALVDDRHMQPAENVTPLIRSELVERWGSDLVNRIDAVSARLSTDDLRELNAKHQAPGTTVQAIAADWLDAEGLT